MDNIEDYIDYGVVFSLSILTVSLSYFLELGSPQTWPILLLLPIQLGFIVEISKAGFHKASLFSIPAFFFAFLGTTTAIMAIITVLMSVLSSFFAGGRSFKDFYASTALPLLLTGLILGGGSYYMITTDEAIENEIEQNIIEMTVYLSDLLLEDAMGDQPEEQNRIIESSAENMVVMTEAYVMNHTAEELGPQEMQLLTTAFSDAREDIPKEAVEQQEQQLEEEDDLTFDHEEQMEQIISGLIEPKYYIMVLPILAVGAYSLQPLIGVLTGIFAIFFYRIRSN